MFSAALLALVQVLLGCRLDLLPPDVMKHIHDNVRGESSAALTLYRAGRNPTFVEEIPASGAVQLALLGNTVEERVDRAIECLKPLSVVSKMTVVGAMYMTAGILAATNVAGGNNELLQIITLFTEGYILSAEAFAAAAILIQTNSFLDNLKVCGTFDAAQFRDDVTKQAHEGAWQYELTINSESPFDTLKEYIAMSHYPIQSRNEVSSFDCIDLDNDRISHFLDAYRPYMTSEENKETLTRAFELVYLEAGPDFAAIFIVWMAVTHPFYEDVFKSFTRMRYAQRIYMPNNANCTSIARTKDIASLYMQQMNDLEEQGNKLGLYLMLIDIGYNLETSSWQPYRERILQYVDVAISDIDAVCTVYFRKARGVQAACDCLSTMLSLRRIGEGTRGQQLAFSILRTDPEIAEWRDNMYYMHGKHIFTDPEYYNIVGIPLAISDFLFLTGKLDHSSPEIQALVGAYKSNRTEDFARLIRTDMSDAAALYAALKMTPSDLPTVYSLKCTERISLRLINHPWLHAPLAQIMVHATSIDTSCVNLKRHPLLDEGFRMNIKKASKDRCI